MSNKPMTVREFLVKCGFDARTTSTGAKEWSGRWSQEAEDGFKNGPFGMFYNTFFANVKGHPDFGKRCIAVTIFNADLDKPMAWATD